MPRRTWRSAWHRRPWPNTTQLTSRRLPLRLPPPRLNLGKLDLLNPPSKEILAQECELRDLPVKRSGDDTAYPRQATELVQFLVQRLRDFHDGSNDIPKMTSFGAGKKLMSWNSSSGGGGDTTEHYITDLSSPS